MATLTSGDSVKLSSGMNGIAEKTFETWQQRLDPGKRWMKVAIVDGHVVRVWCALCIKHGDRLKGFRNFSGAYITGISYKYVLEENYTERGAHCAPSTAKLM